MGGDRLRSEVRDQPEQPSETLAQKKKKGLIQSIIGEYYELPLGPRQT